MQGLPEVVFLAKVFHGNRALLDEAIAEGAVTKYRGKDNRWWMMHATMEASESVINRKGEEWKGASTPKDQFGLTCFGYCFLHFVQMYTATLHSLIGGSSGHMYKTKVQLFKHAITHCTIMCSLCIEQCYSLYNHVFIVQPCVHCAILCIKLHCTIMCSLRSSMYLKCISKGWIQPSTGQGIARCCDGCIRRL